MSHFSTLMSQRFLVWISCLTIVFVTAATSLAPPRVDDAMVERAISGAEWLAEQALDDPVGMEKAIRETDLVDWLLVASGASGAEYDAFAERLSDAGYEGPLFAVSEWLVEISRVLVAAKASERASELRPLSVVRDDIKALPEVPQDEAGQEARDRLLEEWVLSAIPQEARHAASAAQMRINVLQESFQREVSR